MKKFLGVKKRALPKSNLSSSSGKSIKNISISSPIPSGGSGTGPQSKQTKLVMLMNKAGMKMQELRNVLHQESVLSHKEPDNLRLRAFLRHYTRQIEVVDAIRNSDSNSNIRGKEGYHCFLEDLQLQQSFSQSQLESNLGECSKSCYDSVDGSGDTDHVGGTQPSDRQNAPRDELEISEVDGRMDEDIVVGARHRNHVSGDGFKKSEADGRITRIDSGSLQNRSKTDVTSKENGRIGRMDSGSLQNRSKTDLTSKETDVPNKLIIDDWRHEAKSLLRSVDQSYAALSRSKLRLSEDVDVELQSDFEDKSEVSLKRYLKLIDRPVQTESDLPNDSDQDIIDASLISCKSKVIRRPKKSRGRIDDLFSLNPDSESVEKPITSTPLSSRSVFRKVDSFDRSPIEDIQVNFLAGGDSEDAAWKNRSKSKNESWYEFKERCSRTSLHSFSHNANGRSTPTETSVHKSSFLIKDYVEAMDGSGSRSFTSPKTKCVRFNLRKDDVTSEDSSSDDEAPFEVDQFPCARPTYRKSHRRIK